MEFEVGKTYITPKGTLKFTQLNIPKENDQGVKKYSTGLVLDEEEGLAFHDAIVNLVKETFGKGKGVTIPNLKEDQDKDGNKSGKYVFNFAQNAEINGDPKTVPFFDSKGAPITGTLPRVGFGTVAKLSFVPVAYELTKGIPKKGITLALRAVQILELAEFGGGNYGFGEEDGSYTSDSRSEFEQQADYPDANKAKPKAKPAKPQEPLDDEIPF